MPIKTLPPIVVAGHICLDLIPEITTRKSSMEELLVPGKLLSVGPVTTATGGAVANTGLALHRLGLPVRLVGKIGVDPFGDVLLSILSRHGQHLKEYMVADPRTATSYSIVLNPPGIDRVFLHCSGANDSFGAPDIRPLHLAGASIFHFGYPPLMRRLYDDGGTELELIFHKARAAGLITSLDMAHPDPDSEAGRVNWKLLLRRVLPQVDIFQPSYDELAFMLGEDADSSLESAARMAKWVLEAGASICVVKMGAQGLYLRTAGPLKAPISALGSNQWANRQLFSPCWQVDAVGTTGAGDCTIAGFLAGIAQRTPPEPAMALATAVGACSVEAPDANSGVMTLQDTEARMRTGWKRCVLPNPAWTPSPDGSGTLLGPADRRER